MKLTDHSPVDNICDLKIDQERYILFNSVIYLAKICQIRSKDSIIVSFKYQGKPFSIATSINLIYKELPK